MKRLHIHCTNELINVNNLLNGFKKCYFESILIHLSYWNVMPSYNDTFYLTATNQITLTPGFYNLDSLNNLFQYNGFFKLILAPGAQYYKLYKFSTLSTWLANDLTDSLLIDYTNTVKNLSTLNKQIYNMTFFNGIICKISNIIEDYSYGENNLTQIETSTDIEIPITSKIATQ